MIGFYSELPTAAFEFDRDPVALIGFYSELPTAAFEFDLAPVALIKLRSVLLPTTVALDQATTGRDRATFSISRSNNRHGVRI